MRQLVLQRSARGLDGSLAFERVDECQCGGGPAAQSGAGVVTDGAERVRVDVDRSRKHETAGRVDDIRA